MSEEKKVSSSRVVKGRKSINYLQKLKDEGTPIVQMCQGTANLTLSSRLILLPGGYRL